MAADPGLIPAVMVEVILAASGKPDWADFYVRTLLALNDILIEHKIDLEAARHPGGVDLAGGTPKTNMLTDRSGGLTRTDDIAIQYSMMRHDARLAYHKRVEMRRLRRAVEQCMVYRKLSAFLIDEAHHFRKMAVSGQKTPRPG